MSKKKKASGALARIAGPGPVVRIMAGHEVVVDAIYHSREVHPSVPGPWVNEADKIAWTDPLHGYGCIIRRDERRGHLGGFVGIGPRHPLFGWEEYALRAAGLRVHGGIGYARECDNWGGVHNEDRSICHVPRNAGRAARSIRSHEVVLEHAAEDDLWWIGFECDKAHDVVPKPEHRRSEESTYDGAVDPVYRDEGYVFEQCVSLAAQLAAIEQGRDPVEAVLAFEPGPRSAPPSKVVR